MHDTGMAQYRHVHIGTTGAYPITGEGGWERKLAQGAARVLRGRLALRPNEVSPRARLRTAVRSARARLGADSIRAVLTSAVVP